MRAATCFSYRQLVIIFLFAFLSAHAQKDPSPQAVSSEELLANAKNIRYENPDSAIQLLERGYLQLMEKQDTINAINALSELAVVTGNQANYVESYDVLWKALLLADASHNEKEEARLYIEIGRYYSFYKRKEDAIKHFQLALDINKSLVALNKLDQSALTSNYYAFASTYRELDEPELGKRYLDSCYLYYKPDYGGWHFSNLEFEKAFILNQEGKHQEALAIYEEITPWFEENTPSYFVLIDTYIGDVYYAMNNLNMSEQYYLKALEVSATYHSHIDFSPLVHERLADLYLQKGERLRAFESLKKAKELDAMFFDSRSVNNQPLFAIQDAYRKEKEYQKELLRQQHITELEQNEKISFLQKIILAGALVLLSVLGLWYFNYVRSKHKAEKLFLKQKQELEMQKANELVELKNKELATSALKLIEKDELFSALKEKLKNGNDAIAARELKQIIKTNSINNARNWKEFEARFVAVNGSFYKKLAEKFPNLSQSDQKLCALIKLNFSSKEMSKLLGISVESVHTSRYRLRKKLSLSRDVNLTNFIAGL